METIMKKASWAAALLLVILMVLGLGCASDKGGGTGGGGNTGVGSVQIIMLSDTVSFLPGDSCAVYGFVVVKDLNGVVMRGIKVDFLLSQPFGFIEYANQSLRDTTNDVGRVEFYFRSYNQAGIQTISATAGGRSDSWLLVVLQQSQVVATLNVTVDRDAVDVAPQFEDSIMVTVTVADSSHNGVPNLVVHLSATGGRLRPIAPTDSTGRAVTYWYTNGQYGTFTIWARVSYLTDSVLVTVDSLPDIRGTLHLTTDLRVIRADRCVTVAHLTAALSNRYGVAVTNDTVSFATPHLGSATSFGITDSLGLARAYYCEMGIPSADTLDSGIVVARYDRWNLKDTVRIYIEPASHVETVNLTVGNQTGIAGVESTDVQVRAYNADGSGVHGIWCHFGVQCGDVTPDSIMLTHGANAQNIYYKFCNQTTDAAHRAMIWAQVENVTSDTMFFVVNPGPARRLRIATASSAIPINERMAVWADVSDSLNNAVRAGVAVVFETTLGTLSPPSPVATNAEGRANVELNPGTQAGQTTIKASLPGIFVDSAVVTILSGTPAGIELQVSNNSPQVAGTGGIDWSQLLAYVRDTNGNFVPDGQWVIFEIIADPGGGCSINRHGRIDSAQTASGLAMATFNAGTIPGPVVIEARTLTEGIWITARASNINIVSGPPNTMDIEASNVGIDVPGGAAWDLPVSALVRDLYNNNVRDGIAVFFEVHPDTAEILSDSVITGNGGVSGIAFTTLRFLSSATNQIVYVTGRTADGVSETIELKLPLQQPTINLYCQPAMWHFIEQGDPCYIRCESVVQDGHQILVNDVKVMYTITRGALWTTRTGNTRQNYQYTGPAYGDPTPFADGHCALWLRSMATYIFPDPNTAEITGDVSVEVEGYPQAIDSQILNFLRGTGR